MIYQTELKELSIYSMVLTVILFQLSRVIVMLSEEEELLYSTKLQPKDHVLDIELNWPSVN